MLEVDAPAGPVRAHMPDLSDAHVRKQYAPVVLKAFIRISESWGINVKARCTLLGGIPQQTYYKWARGQVSTLSRDVLERISVILGVHKGLQLFFVDDFARLRWLEAKNEDTPFQGQSPLERMMGGSLMDLYAVRQYVDALRGGR